MRNYKIYLMAALTALLVNACVADYDEEQIDTTSPKMMPVRLRLATPDDGMPTTRAQLKGETSVVTSLWMLCFDQYGAFVGKYQATIGSTATATKDFGTIVGEVPELTSRIHFVANYEPKIGAPEMSKSEEELMLSAKMASVYNEATNTGCIYWGYVKKETPAEMLAFIQGTPVGEGENPPYTPANTVYLIRDRAKVMINAVATNSGIASLQWCVSDARTKGYIPATDKSKIGQPNVNPFEGYYQKITTEASGHAPKTGYSEYEGISVFNEYTLDDERFQAEESDLKTWNSANKEASAIFLYEDENDITDPIRLIIKVTYDADHGGGTKYHAVLLTDNDQNQLKVLRNRVYWLTINKLPADMGETTFAKALTTKSYTNNQLVDIAEEVSKVSNGLAEMDVNDGSTSVLFTTPTAGGEVSIPFTFIDPNWTNANAKGPKYQEIDINGNLVGDPKNFTVDDLSITWKSNKYISDISSDNLHLEYNWNTGEGAIKFKINEITTTLKTGELILKDDHYGIQRNIKVYAIQYFQLAETPTLVKTSTNRNVGNADIHTYNCPTYQLNLKIPASYAAGLFPITLEMATSTLNPYSDTAAGTQSGSFSVTIKSTNNLPSSNTNTDWNYHCASGDTWSGWGYWYEYTISQRPAGIGDNENVPITLYFDDIRPTRLETQNISQVGLYLKIKNFKSVSGSTTSDYFTITAN